MILLPGIDLLIPGRTRLGNYLFGQRRQSIAGIRYHWDVHTHILPDLRRIHVDVDDLGMGSEAGDLSCHAVVESGAHGQDQVRLLNGIVGVLRAMHSQHPQRQRMVLWEAAHTHESSSNRGIDLGRQVEELAVRVGIPHPATSIDHRPLGIHKCLGRLLDLHLVRLEGRMIARQVHLRPGELHLLHGHVPGQVDEHRPGAARVGDVESLPEDLGYLPGAAQEVVVLGYGQSDSSYVRLLEGVLADQPGVHLSGDGHHGHGVHVGVGNASDQVRCPWPGGGDADADLARGSGIAVGHVCCSLLMAHQNVADI
ncbi:Uncharacterised protein [uncultured archaeon]|nr:Uncharacterised protein [uncultured archaeon]